MKRPHISPALVISLVALFVSLSGTAWAATGGNFILGQANSATTQTGLTANFTGKTLQLTNTSTATGATPLGLTPGAGRPPFQTPSTTKVANLNADKLDGLDSTQLQRRVTGTCTANSAVQGVAAGGAVSCAAFPQGSSPINVDMPFSRTDHGTTTVFSGNGLTLTATCYYENSSAGTEGGQMHVDAGAGGDVNATYSFSDFFNPTTVKQDGFTPGSPTSQLDIGLIAATPTETTPYRFEGTLVAHTATNIVSVVFHILINFTSERCQYFGTITPA
jgi:hypothetical protein